MSFKDVTRDGVLKALREFDTLGEYTFLSRYGYGTAKSYHLSHEGKRYPSKAIFGVAHGFSKAGLPFLKFDDFSGGEVQVAKPLRELGFEVVGGQRRNPDWIRDELIVALRFYVERNGNPPGQKSQDIHDLTAALNKLGTRLGLFSGDDNRNAYSVYKKLMNFRQFDDRYQSQGKAGVTPKGKREAEVWQEFAKDPVRLSQTADAILALIDTDDQLESSGLEDDGDIEASEGKLVTRTHRARERSASIVKRKKQKVREKMNGRLACEVCGFDFRQRYGERGDGFIECHHTSPVSELRPGQKTRLADLALVCANCHRMIHAGRPWLTPEELRQRLTCH